MNPGRSFLVMVNWLRERLRHWQSQRGTDQVLGSAPAPGPAPAQQIIVTTIAGRADRGATGSIVAWLAIFMSVISLLFTGYQWRGGQRQARINKPLDLFRT